MDWSEIYKTKLMSAECAVEKIRSGERVYVHPGCAAPTVLTDALLQRAGFLEEVELVHLLTFGKADYTLPQYDGHFRHNGLFLGANVREAVAAGRADYTPIALGQIENLFCSGALPLDVVLLQLSPPDHYGYLSLGVGVDCTLNAARCAKYVIAEVNDRMPRTLGDCFLHVSKLNAIVESSRPLLELKPEPFTDLQRRIGEHVASLIPDGATLQLGIGGIPDAVLACLRDKRDLGIHSEMCSDGVVPLIQAGIINGERKTIHRGKVVVGFVLGTENLFRFVDENPIFEFHPTMYTNDPFVIAQNEKMVAINSAIQVDLTGQVCADSIGTRPYSGFGGQLDFMRGAARSPGGKPIIALPSTARGETISRIVPMLDPGAGVVTTRADVHYVVTEYGVAYLHGKTLRQRAEALIPIAHPKFRNELYDFAAKVHYLDRKPILVG
ncbi:MAG TPA: acetyl-CoA hydrolase/transferase C-terminal domain-containing protein [Bryobacteraceae bacterium]|nr:acetyl-CoA hydrolase/transferase C-terminal domain-containing protein [Bryobacteraceae bacterium]